MEKLIQDLKKIMPFKSSTEVGDIVLVVAEEPQMLLYGVVSGIERDVAKRDEWWHVTLHLLTVPPQKMIWTLRTPQFNGEEIFTMDGNKRFMQAVKFTETPMPAPPDKKVQKHGKSGLRVVK